MLPDGMKAVIHKGTWPVHLFSNIQEKGNVAEKDMYNTFNMGIGMVLAVPAEIAPFVVAEANNKEKSLYYR